LGRISGAHALSSCDALVGLQPSEIGVTHGSEEESQEKGQEEGLTLSALGHVPGAKLDFMNALDGRKIVQRIFVWVDLFATCT
jgi:hypothetical protein